MRTVWKYKIDIKETLDPVLKIPGGGRFLFLKDKKFDDLGYAINPDDLIFETWWAVETDSEKIDVQLHIRGTGHEVPASVNYLGTIFPIYRPPLVLHVWQKDTTWEDMHIVDGKFVPKT